MKLYISLSILCLASSIYSMDPHKLWNAAIQLKYAPTLKELWYMYLPPAKSIPPYPKNNITQDVNQDKKDTKS